MKEKDNGDFVYSFNAEKESSTRQTLHADVITYKGDNGELFVDPSVPHPDSKVNTIDKKSSSRAKVTPEADATYLSAVKRGDMETAQRMVDEVARLAGYPKRLLHGTTQFGFTEADVSKSDDGRACI